MSVFKEEVGYLEGLISKQRQIYPDACDYGVIATSEIKEKMREIIKTLPAMDKPVWKSNSSIIQREYKSNVFWSAEDVTQIRVLYVNDTPKNKEYFSIDLKNIHI